MKEKLTIDQKIEIAKVAARLTEMTVNDAHNVPVQNAISTPPKSLCNDELFSVLYDIVAKKITDEPECF
ncbi:hypothetical protein NLN82_22870 [Citrobacter portucalensis]|uniref:hypothetical protein n=1 Tax=Citrobacter portucalensis TaxID=1639133 RepID=UPI00226B02DF|nr:hypothetical protein [Citrobacter portucalensis]MCX9038871.1 hypothetical protein [Citrobacter portucalensis]